MTYLAFVAGLGVGLCASGFIYLALAVSAQQRQYNQEDDHE